ncbi:hypothetical protein [Brevibacillus agri]|uniref:hypothetical protein n=1 Tax=Brevibacillus agri TaxID=51101 RepID=UPI001F5C7F16|nr:hypothetical protein [Brevibacillus agri]
MLPEAEEIRSYDGRSMQDWLSPTDEKLSFIMEGGGAKGIVIATDTEPILAGGEKSGPELFALYEKIKETGRYFFRAPGAHAARSARGRATDSSGSRRQNRGVKFMNKSNPHSWGTAPVAVFFVLDQKCSGKRRDTFAQGKNSMERSPQLMR